MTFRVDPHQLRNLLHTLTDTELNFMHTQVALSSLSCQNILTAT